MPAGRIEYALGSNIGVDEFVVSDPDTADLDNPGRMAPQTAVSILLLAVGITLQWASPRAAGAGRWMGAAAVIAREFALLMPGTDIDGARAAAERLRAAACATPIPPVGRVTLSAGIGLLSAGERPDDLVRRAGTALYAAKQGGRDLVVAHGAGIER